MRSRASPAPEVFVLFEVVDENASPFLTANIDRFAESPKPDPDNEEFRESNLMHAINGYVFGTGPPRGRLRRKRAPERPLTVSTVDPS